MIIPVRDDQAGLDRAVASVRTAGGDEAEIVVVDDGSDPPIRFVPRPTDHLVRSESAQGPAAARNAGLAAASGRFVAWCDSDDVFAADRLELARALHEHADLAVVGQSDVDRPRRRASVPASLEQCLDAYTPHLGATSIRRELCQPQDERFLACQDIDWWIRTIRQGPSYASSPIVGYHVGRDARARVLNSSRARLEFSYMLLDEHEGFYEQHPRARAFRLRRIASMERDEGSLGLAVHAVRTSLRVNPTPGTVRDLGRLAFEMPHRLRAPDPLASATLPPLSERRASALRPLRRGTAESRLALEPPLLAAVAAATVTLPRPLRGRVRRAASAVTGTSPLAARSSWGTYLLDPSEVRLLAPYTDEPIEMALLARALRPGMTAVDVGANRGVYALMFCARVGQSGRVVAVEPDGRMVDRLHALVAANGLGSQLRIEQCAVSAVSGEREFVLTAEPSLNHLRAVRPAAERHEGPGRRVVPVRSVTCRELFDRHDIVAPDLVKIDVEGTEPDVLESLLDLDDHRLPPLVMFEHEPRHWARGGGADLAGVVTQLSRRDYHLFRIDYRQGGLVSVEDRPASVTGRNIIAVRGPDCPSLLARLVVTPPAASNRRRT